MLEIQYDYDKDEIKENLTIEQIRDLVAELGGDPEFQNGALVSRTICHGGQSKKLYYWDNTHLFKCFTDCGETFDVFELVRKVKSLEQGSEYPLPQAISFVAEYFGYAPAEHHNTDILIKDDLKILQNYDRINNINLETKIVELKEYEATFLKYLPRPTITPWIKDGISKEIMDCYEICFDPKNVGIVIPHRDIDGRLIGIRERTLIAENALKYGKYLPMKKGKKMYNHPLSFNLYGLYQNKDNLKAFQKAFIFESEKAVLQYATMFGQENNIALAVCGSALIQYQVWLLINLGVKEIIVGLDKQYQEINDNEHKKLVRNLTQIHKKYGYYVKIEYLFDKEDIIGYKDSPTDRGKDAFLELYRKRVNLY